jgi:hypothetical protein
MAQTQYFIKDCQSIPTGTLANYLPESEHFNDYGKLETLQALFVRWAAHSDEEFKHAYDALDKWVTRRVHFLTKHDGFEYKAENADPEDEIYHAEDILEMTGGNFELASQLISMLQDHWAFPETVLDELIMEDEIVLHDDGYYAFNAEPDLEDGEDINSEMPFGAGMGR